MKRAMIISLTVAIGLLLTSAAYAMWGGSGAGPCITATGADIETVKKFHKETFSLRDEVMTKKLELRDEYNKPTQDPNRIAAIQKEVIDLKAKIHEIANKHGIKMPAGQGMMGRGMMGKGMMKGACNQCPMSQQ